MKRPEELSVVTLKRDLPEFSLQAGTVGTVVLVYEPDVVEVEFFDRGGDTHALMTLLDEDIRPATKADLDNSIRPEPWPDGTDAPIADTTTKAKR